jgi:ubiquinone/menaquinone biosynthesis C-methylase UbiE
MQDEGWQYVLGSSPTEQERLRHAARLLKGQARRLLRDVGAQPGWHVVDVGCGPHGILDLLSAAVGPTGSVIGLDQDEAHLTAAKALVDERTLRNVRIRRADAMATGLPPDTFDMVHARLLLVTVPNPAQVLTEMVRITRPGGVVAVQDVDNAGWTCHPPHPAWSQLVEGMRAVWNGDLLLTGRRLPGLLRSAGLQDVEFTAHSDGVVRRTHPLHMRILLLAEIVGKRLIERQVFTREELMQLTQSLQAHLEDPNTFVIAPLRFRAWGWKPSLR